MAKTKTPRPAILIRMPADHIAALRQHTTAARIPLETYARDAITTALVRDSAFGPKITAPLTARGRRR